MEEDPHPDWHLTRRFHALKYMADFEYELTGDTPITANTPQTMDSILDHLTRVARLIPETKMKQLLNNMPMLLTMKDRVNIRKLAMCVCGNSEKAKSVCSSCMDPVCDACSYSVLQNCLKLHHTQANNASHPAYTALAARRILTPCANCSIKYEAQVGDCICDSILRVRRYRGFGQRYCGSCFEAVMSFLLDVNNTRLHDGQEDNEFGCTKEDYICSDCQSLVAPDNPLYICKMCAKKCELYIVDASMEALEYWQYRGYPGYCQFYLDGSGFEIKDRKTWRNIAAGQLEPYELYRD